MLRINNTSTVKKKEIVRAESEEQINAVDLLSNK
jgi:hypothetical protein